MISERLARLELIMGVEGLNRLQAATVMVIGLGGVGSACAEALARGGVGNLVLVDKDVVEPSNINRQALAFISTIGRAKTDIMLDMIKDINPDCNVYPHQVFLDRENTGQLLSDSGHLDYVADCIDTVTQKGAIAYWCAQNQVPLLAAMGAANRLDPTKLAFCDIDQTQNCSLSKAVRKQCHKYGIKNVEVLSSTEIPFKVPNTSSKEKAATLGSMSYLPPIMGMMIASQIIRRLAGLEPKKSAPYLTDKRAF